MDILHLMVLEMVAIHYLEFVRHVFGRTQKDNLEYFITVQNLVEIRGIATGGILVYIPPKSVYLTNFYVVTGCFFSLTQDKLLLILKLE